MMFSRQLSNSAMIKGVTAKVPNQLTTNDDQWGCVSDARTFSASAATTSKSAIDKSSRACKCFEHHVLGFTAEVFRHAACLPRCDLYTNSGQNQRQTIAKIYRIKVCSVDYR